MSNRLEDSKLKGQKLEDPNPENLNVERAVTLQDRGLLRAQALINGQWVDAASGAKFNVHNPADNTLIATIPDVGPLDARRAIESADIAGRSWRRLTAKERGAILQRWYGLIVQHQEDLACLITAEQGKPLAEARGEVLYGASFVQWFAEEAKRVRGEIIPSHAAGKRLMVLRQPVGVFAAITPWNFPLAMITRKVAPGLAAGCTAVVKPAPETPLTALALGELASRAGLPQGALNIITCHRATAVGAELTQNPLVRKLSFTGSTEVGKLLMGQCAQTVKRVSLELGGNAPFLVFDDADLDAAIAGAMASKYRNSGQTCVCANRFLVQEGIYEAFTRRLVEAVSKLKMGRGDSEGVTQGPLINDQARHKVESLIAQAVEAGAAIEIGAREAQPGGNFFPPTVLTGVSQEMALAREEIFGPVAPILRFSQEQEALTMANDTSSGLAAYFYTRDADRIWRVAEQLEYGMIGINEGIISTEVAPFGGIKESGLGREGSSLGIDEYLEVKYLCQTSLASAG